MLFRFWWLCSSPIETIFGLIMVPANADREHGMTRPLGAGPGVGWRADLIRRT